MNNKQTIIIVAILLVLGLFLRTFQLSISPPSLYWEEAALGYDAYSIMKTAHDHHGNLLPTVAFESFGDWKPSLYFYYLVPFIWAGGLTPLAVKFSGVVLGLLVMVGIVILAKQLNISMIAGAGVAAVSPWAIHFSRSAWEAHLATVLILWGVIFWKAAVDRNKWWWWISSALSLGLATYAYHSARIMVPVLVVSLLLLTTLPLLKKKQVVKAISKSTVIRKAILTATITAVLMLPILVGLFNPSSSVVTQRFMETGLTSDLSIIQQSNELRDLGGNSVFARVIFHRYVLTARSVIDNLFSYTSLNFWLVNGDVNLRHSPGYLGQIYYFEFILLIWGLVAITKSKKHWLYLLPMWLVIAALPAAFAKPNPHALRILPALPALLLIIAFGLEHGFYWLVNIVKRFVGPQSTLLTASLISVVYVIFTCIFYIHYLKIYPVQSTNDWQYGYQQMVEVIEPYIGGDNAVYLSRKMGRPMMYVWFFSHQEPQEVQAADEYAAKDQGELLTYKNIQVVNDFGQVSPQAADIVVLAADEVDQYVNQSMTELNHIDDLSGNLIWKIVKVN